MPASVRRRSIASRVPFEIEQTRQHRLADCLVRLVRDRATAVEWSESMSAAGVEGIVAMGGEQPYGPDARNWVKWKRRETIDVVVGAVIGTRDRPQALVLGSPSEGRLRIIGRTATLKSDASHQVGILLRARSASIPGRRLSHRAPSTDSTPAGNRST